MGILNEISHLLLQNTRMRISVMHLINNGNGLPVKLLREVYLGSYTVILDKNSNGGMTNNQDKVITLPDGIVQILGKTAIDGITKEAKAIGLLYHEATHAFIDNKLETSDARFHRINIVAKKYYLGGTFDDGSTIPIDGIDSAVTEAAAWYVHVQILIWWLMKEIMSEISIQPPKPYKNNNHHTHIKATISKPTMQDLSQVRDLINRKYFGISWAYGDTYKKINMSICPELKVYCDQVIMEGKVDNYNVTSLLRFLKV